MSELYADTRGRPTKMSLKDLTDIHTGRNAQRIKNNINRRAVLHVRHILFGKDPRNNTLVTMTTGHLVTYLKLPLDGNINLDHLDDTRG